MMRLDTKLPTLGKLIQADGYATAHFGKWHLGRDPYIPENRYGKYVLESLLPKEAIYSIHALIQSGLSCGCMALAVWMEQESESARLN